MNHRLARLATDGKWQVQTVPLGWDLFSGHRLTHRSFQAELAATTTLTPPTAPQLIPLLQAANWLRLHVRAEDRPAHRVASPNLSRHLAGITATLKGPAGTSMTATATRKLLFSTLSNLSASIEIYIAASWIALLALRLRTLPSASVISNLNKRFACT